MINISIVHVNMAEIQTWNEERERIAVFGRTELVHSWVWDACYLLKFWLSNDREVVHGITEGTASELEESTGSSDNFALFPVSHNSFSWSTTMVQTYTIW